MRIYQQAIFSRRLRTRSIPEWCEFLRLWAAFNCLYGEETGGNERDRVMQVVQRYLSEPRSQRLIDQISDAALKIVGTPPGDMRKDASDPQFREQTGRVAAAYLDSSKPSNERLASLMGVIYQVRCNLLHGDKDPDDSRDIRLILSSNAVMQAVIPALEDEIRNAAQQYAQIDPDLPSRTGMRQS